MKTALIFLILSFSYFSNIYAQSCGGSIRTISFEFEKNVKKPKKIYYRLFYLLPKRADRYISNFPAFQVFQHEIAVFLSGFLYDNPNPSNDYFWVGNWEADEKFIKVSTEKARKYIADYHLKDFEGFWAENHLSQLQGKICDGVLELQTTETDYLPFLLEIKADGFESLYFVTNFLGGCFLKNGKPVIQHIKMKIKQDDNQFIKEKN